MNNTKDVQDGAMVLFYTHCLYRAMEAELILVVDATNDYTFLLTDEDHNQKAGPFKTLRELNQWLEDHAKTTDPDQAAFQA